MIISLDIPDDTLAALLQEANIRGTDAASLAVETLKERHTAGGADEVEAVAWWDSLSEEQRERIIAKVAQGLADIDAGRTRPAEEVYARVRSRFSSAPAK